MTINITDGTLKATHGEYVIYKRDYLLKHLAREIYLLEGTQRMMDRMGDPEKYKEAMRSVVMEITDIYPTEEGEKDVDQGY